MKYIMLEQRIGNVPRKIPIIFPDILNHSDVALAITSMLTNTQNIVTKVVSAGEFNNFMCDYTIGKSTTLNVESDPDDAEVINMDFVLVQQLLGEKGLSLKSCKNFL